MQLYKVSFEMDYYVLASSPREAKEYVREVFEDLSFPEDEAYADLVRPGDALSEDEDYRVYGASGAGEDGEMTLADAVQLYTRA